MIDEDDEPLDPELVVDLREAARLGNRRGLLEAMRDVLASKMAIADSMVIAQIAGRLQAIAKELDELPLDAEASISDDLAARRKTRRTKAAADSGAAGGNI